MTSATADLGTRNRNLKWAAGTACAALFVGFAIAEDPSLRTVLFALALIATAAWCTWAIICWRSTAQLLFFFIPFAALPAFVLGAQGWPTLLKDVLFVLPIYAGALIAYWSAPGLFWLPRPVLALIAVLTVIVLLQALVGTINAGALVALVGLKVWLWYIPLIFVPRLVFSKPSQVVQWVRLVVLIAMIPSIIGVVEAALVYSGDSAMVYGLYGSLAGPATQDFAILGLSDDLLLHRIPSTFTFVTQYYAYLVTVFPLAVAAFFGAERLRWRLVMGVAVIVVAAAGVTSGARGFLAWLPVQIVLMVILGNRGRWLLLVVTIVGISALVLTAGQTVGSASSGVFGLVRDYLGTVFADQWDLATRGAGLFGAGTGTATNAARYVLGDPSAASPGIEVWYAKAAYELGILGVIVIVLLWLVLARELWIARQHILVEPLQPVGSGIIVVFITAIGNLYKGPYLDLDPLNVYFWFIVGLGLALPSIASRVAGRNLQL